MFVVGFGTSLPELFTSMDAAYHSSSGIALGNVFGSNIFNIAFILGITAIINSISVHTNVFKTDMMILLIITGVSLYLIKDGLFSRADGLISLVLFSGYMFFSFFRSKSNENEPVNSDIGIQKHAPYFSTFSSLLLLITSSKLLVWSASEIASTLGVTDLIIGLTIVAAGTSLPELASSIASIKKGHSDLVIGNIVGSNIFNLLVVIGLSSFIKPLAVSSDLFNRDALVMLFYTVTFAVMAYGFGKTGKINRIEGIMLVLSYLGYTWLIAV